MFMSVNQLFFRSIKYLLDFRNTIMYHYAMANLYIKNTCELCGEKFIWISLEKMSWKVTRQYHEYWNEWFDHCEVCLDSSESKKETNRDRA